MSLPERRKEDFAGQKMIVLPERIINLLVNNDITKYLYVTDMGYFPKAGGHFRQRSQGSMSNILIYCINGTGWISVDGKKENMTKDQFCFIPAGTPHTYAAGRNDPWTIYWVHYSGEHAERTLIGYNSGKALAKSLSERKPPANNGLAPPKRGIIRQSILNSARREARIRLFDEIFLSLISEYTEKELEYTTMMLYHFLGSFTHEKQFAGAGEQPPFEDLTSRAITFMKQHLSKKITLEEVANHCEVSVSHFCLLFKRKTSHTPVEFLNNLRIQQACRLLDLTNLNISEISEKLGFSDPFYFSRVFKKSIGQSPRDYRKQKSG
jgi:AraC-like DNA-binding protein